MYKKILENTPKALALELTYRCNLNCVYCAKRDSGESCKDISVDLLNRLDSVIRSMKRIIICGIGESFLYPEIYRFISDYPKQKFSIVTNGTILIDYKRLDKSRNIEQIVFSIDAVEEDVLNKISGKYRVDNLFNNLNSLLDYCNIYQRRIISVLNCTINKYNLMQIVKLVEFAYIHKFNVIHFSLPRGSEEFICKEKSIIVTEVQKARELAKFYNIFWVDPFDVCCAFYNCIPPFITLDGNVYTCAETLYTSKVLGNIYKRDYEEIMKDPEYKKFQRGISCNTCGFLQNTYIGR